MAVAEQKQSSTTNDSLSHIDNMLQKTSARLESSRQWVASQTNATIDKAVTPEQRKELQKKAQSFFETNPRLAAFLMTNLVLSGIPVLLFLGFSLSTLVFSVLTGLLLGLLSALAFTATSVGLALLVLLPTVFFTTIAAVFLFAWGLVGYTVLTWTSQTRNRVRSNDIINRAKRITERQSLNEQSAKHDSLRFSESKQNELPFDFSSDKQLSVPEHPPSYQPSATALPTDRKLTSAMPIKQEHNVRSINVPTTGTTGMMAS